jgi:predicted nucleic acid-binding protein
MALVVDASVALKWVLQEPDNLLAEALLSSAEELFVPELWLHQAANVLWVQVHRRTTPQRRS